MKSLRMTLAAVALACTSALLSVSPANAQDRGALAELDRLLNDHVHQGGSVPSAVLAAAQAERGQDARRVGKYGSCSFVYRIRSGERVRFMICDTNESGEEGGR